MIEPLLRLSSAFGLSASAGLNAYIPLLLVSIMANRGVIHLTAPYDVMGTWWCITILAILCVVELVVDKVPGADHVNDAVQTVVRPTAGAILFASEAGVISSAHPGVWITLGLLTAGGVHAVKAVARPPINVATVGIGAPVVSVVENVMATVVSLVALLAPVLTLLLMGVIGWLGYKGFRRLVGNGGRTRGRAGAYSVVEAPRGRVVATGAPPVVATPPMS
jgi:uncharacterized membrane protein